MKKRPAQNQGGTPKRPKILEFTEENGQTNPIYQKQSWTVKPSAGEIRYPTRTIANGTYTVQGPTVHSWTMQKPHTVTISHGYFRIPITPALPQPAQHSTISQVNDSVASSQSAEHYQQVAPSAPDVMINEQKSTPQKIAPNYTQHTYDLPPLGPTVNNNAMTLRYKYPNDRLAHLMEQHLTNLGGNVADACSNKDSEIIFDAFILQVQRFERQLGQGADNTSLYR